MNQNTFFEPATIIIACVGAVYVTKVEGGGEGAARVKLAYELLDRVLPNPFVVGKEFYEAARSEPSMVTNSQIDDLIAAARAEFGERFSYRIIVDRKWDGMLDILDYRYKLDWADLSIWNGNRLPKWLLFRQPLWRYGEELRPGSELFLELAQPGSVSPSIDIRTIARDAAVSDSSSVYTLVEMIWPDRHAEEGPWITDIRVYDRDGSYVDSHTREREARLAAKAAR